MGLQAKESVMSEQAPSAGMRELATLALAGTAAVTVGIGLARFGFIVIMPLLTAAGWFAAGQTAWLGAANLLGYFAGALSAHALAQRMAPGHLIRGAMLAIAVSFWACSLPWGFAWFFGWRFVSGVAGAGLMVLASPLALADTPERLRGRVNGIIFTGIGIGVVATGLGVPVLAGLGVEPVWQGLSLLVFAMTALSWPCWRTEVRMSRLPLPLEPADSGQRPALALLFGVYGLAAVGFLPHTVFWVDYLVRTLGHSLAVGGLNWTVFGLGALAGPILSGMMADRVGFRTALLAALGIKAAAVAIPLVTTASSFLLLSSLLVGALTPGVVMLVSGTALEIAGRSRHRQAWGRLTLAFACAQAVASSLMAFLYAWTGSYLLLFALATVALLLAVLLALRLWRLPLSRAS